MTIAGNLDIKYWADKHYFTPLIGSLNPADFSEELTSVTQIHLIGEKDKVIDKSIYDSYLSKFSDKRLISQKVYKNFTHSSSWVKEWSNILKSISIK